jgi:hypothetical protein
MFNKLFVKLLKFIEKKFPPTKEVGYLGRDLSKHRVHSSKYEDLCK